MNNAQNLGHRIWKAIEWRIGGPVERATWAIRCWFLYGLALLYRPWLRNTAFVGITGSAGKTTAKDLLASILANHLPKGVKGPGSFSFPYNIARLVLGTRASDSYCVSEIGLSNEFRIDQSLALFRPTVGVVTNIGYDHMSAYGGREGVVREKSKLIGALPPDGIAVLNADDPLVLGMREHFSGRTITYGLSENAMLRGEAVEASWPDRLSLTVCWNGERFRVSTRLCGSHWASAVLAALAAGVAMGVPLAAAAAAVGEVEPYDGRMQPVTTEDGITFIRDDFKAPLWTLDASLEFMRSARAGRKIIVIGELSDTGTGKETKYFRAAVHAQEVADIVIFVGPWSSNVHKARKPGKEGALRTFGQVHEASKYVNSITRTGDLILLKGTNKQDHLQRIILARNGDIACWRDDCRRVGFCDVCPSKDQPSGYYTAVLPQTYPETAAPLPPSRAIVSPEETVVVGLGNPEEKYSGTPHNVGYEVVEHLAVTQGFLWEESPDAWVSRGTVAGRPICLVKVRTFMNLTGGGLKRLSDSMSFGPAQCILVFDELALPLGSVRLRMNGSAGGHRGVASVLEAFQTDAFRRVKIGVGKDGTRHDSANHVLSLFDSADRTTADQSIREAAARILELVTRNKNPP